jgi:hypothetical protein
MEICERDKADGTLEGTSTVITVTRVNPVFFRAQSGSPLALSRICKAYCPSDSNARGIVTIRNIRARVAWNLLSYLPPCRARRRCSVSKSGNLQHKRFKRNHNILLMVTV